MGWAPSESDRLLLPSVCRGVGEDPENTRLNGVNGTRTGDSEGVGQNKS